MTGLLLSPLFLTAAFLYAAVGLGGGSAYTALMAIAGIHYDLIPSITLLLNLAVTSIGVYQFWRGQHLKFSIIFPFLVTSIPLSYYSGSLLLPKELFFSLLTATLVVVAIRIYLINDLRLKFQLTPLTKIVLSLIIGALLGFISGSVGIGGGIYLVPLIIMLGVGTPKEAAAAGALFIWANSLSGLSSRFQRGAVDLELMLPLLAAVIIGGALGARFGSLKSRPETIEKLLGVVVLAAIGLLVYKLFFIL
ncbi:MAG: sulfite exporter TauE/SafE family protein [Arenicellales bacterium]|jgi:hypothetical protein|nr:hypothetical protein [Acidiferrobacteraceae bacterium]MDP6289719.1 sulfite exporter TauE/SafE family protein [Arenicellales bacterium]MAG00175.1 hypothetical protein [Acidiferrobacteraceae bacterium]MDP6434303.1 sulfite exporter TauE/SafE family protein [Arenicellales bacterium]MDP6671767.1 sulfite exporter TauE/SafE family protein [Arenicellales bacterium]|tara:strand:- start:40407 stop:41156 length:750 start_codon:yes stop_codon:yes gene_type:complete